jgi:hypothetical protein
MSNLPAMSPAGGRMSRRMDRQLDRAVAQAHGWGQAVAAQEMAKIDAIADVTEAALVATSHVSVMEALLVARTPHAEGRLRHIADAGTAGMANVVLGMGRLR